MNPIDEAIGNLIPDGWIFAGADLRYLTLETEVKVTYEHIDTGARLVGYGSSIGQAFVDLSRRISKLRTEGPPYAS